MARVLFIDDDRDLVEVLAIALRAEGHDVHLAHDGGDADRRVQSDRYDVIISDVNLPVLDGFTLVKRWRARGDATPVLMLTARDSEIDQALGLELGADDYVAKPVSVRVLAARIAALVRRSSLRSFDPRSATTTLTCGGCVIDKERLELRYRDVLVATTLSELRLVEALLERPGIVRSRAQLLEHVRGEGSVVDDRLIDTYVRRMRRKLEDIEPAFDRIETVTGAGYRWRDR